MTIRKDGTGVGYAVHSGVVNVRPHEDSEKEMTEVVVLLKEIEALHLAHKRQNKNKMMTLIFLHLNLSL